MGRLIVTTEMTLDGVTDQLDKWYMPRYDLSTQAGAADIDQLRAAVALICGRKNYEGFAAVWPQMTDDFGYADLINAMPKYVASRSLADPLKWNATLLKGELTESVGALKRDMAGNLLSHGCGEFTQQLLSAGLVDELLFRIHPIVWGDGERPFDRFDKPGDLRLASTTSFDNGVVQLTYRQGAAAPGGDRRS